VIGGALGVLIAYVALPVIVSLASNQLPPLGPIAMDAGVLVVALAITLVVGVLVGVAPVIESRRGAMQASLKEGSTSTTPARWTQRTSSGLIAAEVGLALVLLTAMGLITRSFVAVMTLDRGYDTEAVLMARIGIPPRYDSIPNGRVALRLAALDRLEAIPGVASAAAATSAPLLGSRATRLSADGARPTEASPFAELLTVSGRYFETLGIPFRHGRAPRAPGEVVLDETAAKMLFPNESAMGRSVAWGSLRRPTPSNSGTGVVVGIVGDLREVGWDDEADPELSIQPHIYHTLAGESADNFAIRTAHGDPARLFPAFRAAFGAIDPDITVDIGDSVGNMLRGRFARERFLTQLMIGLSAIALFLAAIGIYSVVSYAAERRVREIGIRVALGAARLDIIALMMRRALIPVGVGVIVGIAGSIASGRLLRRQLFEVSPTEPLVLAAATVVLCLATIVASYLPSRRATRVEPTMVLREE
jgi:predicted permease